MVRGLRFPSGMLTLVRDDSAGKSWDRFVEQHAAATVAHLSAWGRIAAGAYGHPSAYLSVEDDGEKLGVLPLVLVSSRIFGRRLVSMPFLDYGGVLVSPPPPTCNWLRPLYDPYYDALWKVCEDLGVVVNSHSGAGGPAYKPAPAMPMRRLALAIASFSLPSALSICHRPPRLT